MAIRGLWRSLVLFGMFWVCRGDGGQFYFYMKSYSSGCRETFSVCDIRFKFCFTRPRNNPTISDCDFLETAESNDYHNTNNIGMFGSTINGINNPMIFNVTNYIDARVLVVIRLMDENVVGGNDHIITTWTTITVTPAASLSAASYVHGEFTDRGHTFRYKYMAFCNPNYFGPYCATYCVPRDDNMGHYSCGSNGMLVCNSGWQGDRCTVDINECDATPTVCSEQTNNRSECLNSLGSYSCQCFAGWRGSNCNQDVDECSEASSPLCFNGGTCSNTPGSYRCDCPTNWRGSTCTEDVDECTATSSPCTLANTQCDNTIGGYRCVCTEGWTGDNCTEDVNECRTGNGTCYNNGTCANLPGTYMCECPAGWTGQSCETDKDECDVGLSPCLDNATCANVNGSFHCICANGSLGCYRPVSVGTTTESTTTSTSAGTTGPTPLSRTGDGEEEFVWWPILLVIILLIIIALIVCIVLLVRRRRRQKTPRSKPPSATELQGFKADSIMFENSLYNVKKTRPQSTSSDPTTRSPMPLPGAEDKPEAFKDDMVIYHEVDEQDDLKNGSDVNTDPHKPPLHHGLVNAYANGPVRLDMKTHAGEANHYEDFDALKQYGDSSSHRNVDDDGYSKPRGVTRIRPDVTTDEESAMIKNDKVDERDEGHLIKNDTNIDEHDEGHLNPVFEDDGLPKTHEAQDRLIAREIPIPDDFQRGDMPQKESGFALATAPPLPPEAGFEEDDGTQDQTTTRNQPDDQEDGDKNHIFHRAKKLSTNTEDADLGEEDQSPATEHHFTQAVGELEAFEDDDDDDDDDVLEFLPSPPEDIAVEDHVDIQSLGETVTDDPVYPSLADQALWQYPEYEIARRVSPKY